MDRIGHTYSDEREVDENVRLVSRHHDIPRNSSHELYA